MKDEMMNFLIFFIGEAQSPRSSSMVFLVLLQPNVNFLYIARARNIFNSSINGDLLRMDWVWKALLAYTVFELASEIVFWAIHNLSSFERYSVKNRGSMTECPIVILTFLGLNIPRLFAHFLNLYFH